MNEQMLPVFFWLMAASLGAWFFLMSRLLTLLKEKYPALFQSLGNPGLFRTLSRKTAKTTMLRWLVTRSYLAHNDSVLDRLCEGLRAVGLLFLVMACVSLMLVVF